MEICMVCLEYSDNLKNNAKEEEHNVERIIEKHLWWWSFKQQINSTTAKWICRLCWTELWSFHTFYQRVEKAHNLFYNQLSAPLTKDINEVKPDTIIHEEQPNECGELTEDLIPITKRKRGRPRLQNESLNIEELCVVEVKNETDSLDPVIDPVSDAVAGTVSDSVTDPCPDPVQHETNSNLSEDNAEPPALDFEEEYKSCSSSSESKSSEDDVILTKAATKKRRKTYKTVANKKEKSTEGSGTSSVQITKKYDEFIAQNHELFCSLCHVPLSDFQNLIVHFRDEHNTKAFAMCCGKKFFKRAVFVDHLYIHKDPEYFKCQHCGKVLSNRRCLKNHLEWHDDTRKPRFNCEECGKDFFRRGSLEKHKLLHVPEEERNFQCTECEKKFASESLRTQHLKVTHLNKYAKICDICGKPFRERHSFQRHLAEHTGIPTAPIQCDICGMPLTSIYGLNRHKRLRHTEENMQEQICPYCSKVSPNIAAHRSHIQYSHTMTRRHACHLCEKAFRRPKELKEHLSTHTGEALYTCPYCPRTFISNANMHKHRKNEHPKEWEEARMKRLSSYKIAVNDNDTTTCAK